ncbi:hypothetical protein BC938DRAFT_475027 [Jimgerdemannia flammicorona]|uniref:Uncharacterized protein n=1 Tax=Jimgerdemannia flammicorona TaxID=994334 RepID=A0A433Q138_9FUNG|nr:hypothetical protein BC938DRAFT_475027 [Jimgerdemannia flammicorona]
MPFLSEEAFAQTNLVTIKSSRDSAQVEDTPKKGNEAKRNETKRNETKRNETKRNETKPP